MGARTRAKMGETARLPGGYRLRMIGLVTTIVVARVVSATVLLGQETPDPAAETDRPNILWIIIEDISPHLGCYGDAYASTPSVDRFASAGVRYTRAFSAAPLIWILSLQSARVRLLSTASGI